MNNHDEKSPFMAWLDVAWPFMVIVTVGILLCWFAAASFTKTIKEMREGEAVRNNTLAYDVAILNDSGKKIWEFECSSHGEYGDLIVFRRVVFSNSKKVVEKIGFTNCRSIIVPKEKPVKIIKVDQRSEEQ